MEDADIASPDVPPFSEDDADRVSTVRPSIRSTTWRGSINSRNVNALYLGAKGRLRGWEAVIRKKEGSAER